jgi:CUG-BP- and ETR3-like factor
MDMDMKATAEGYAIESLSSHGKGGENCLLEPDTDSIKLFIGQIPRSMGEEEIRAMFEEYGPVFQVVVLKDQGTMENKGCAFLTYFTRQAAIDAQNGLHGQRTLQGMKNPLQVKPANSELKNEEERRLFVGMLPKTLSDNDLTVMFAPYGALEDCVILKDRDGQSKGCAFVTYASRKSAQLAIKSLHHSRTLEGCRMPLVVKPADTQKEKEIKSKQKKMLDTSQNSSPYMSLLQQAMGGSHMASMGSGLGSGQFSEGGSSHMGSGSNLSGPSSGYNAPLGSRFPQQSGGPGMTQQFPMSNQGQGMNSPAAGFQDIASALTAIASNPVLNTLLNPNMALLQQLSSMNTPSPGMMPSGQSNTSMSSGGMYGSQQGNSGMRNVARPYFNSGKGHAEGPEGCNLFIYHIPEEFGDSDLMQVFQPFGSIVSSRVFVDKKTGISKGFGFVSYDNPMSAKNAIQAMNGFQIGNRRLKVELKKPRSEGKPY